MTSLPGSPGGDEPRLERYQLHAEVCKVLTDPKRLMLIDALRHGEATVGELALRIGISLPNASQHLAVLRNAGLVEGRRVGTTVLYRLEEPEIVEACDVVHRIVGRRLAARSPAHPRSVVLSEGAAARPALPGRPAHPVPR
jgi:ArsR family transcriptional regulator